MENIFKPAGYNAVSPYLIIDGAQKMIDLLTQIFEAQVTRRFDRSDGSIMHAEVKIDDSVIMISDATEQNSANQMLLHVYVPDVDDTYRKAIAMGCQPAEEPQEREGDPDRRGMFKDFAGNMWAIGTQVN